jgi:hypothetical protein
VKIHLCICLIVFGSVLYHIGQKSIPKTSDSLLILCSTYAIALLIVLVAYAFLRSGSVSTTFNAKSLMSTCSTAVILVGVGAVCIELGFLFVYRFGGTLSLTTLKVTALSLMIMIPIDGFVFQTQMNALNWVGVGMGLISVFLISLK